MTSQRPWTAGSTFTAALTASLGSAVILMAIAAFARVRHGDLHVADAELLLGGLYWVTYPTAFLALGALVWYLVRFYRGDYAA